MKRVDVRCAWGSSGAHIELHGRGAWRHGLVVGMGEVMVELEDLFNQNDSVVLYRLDAMYLQAKPVILISQKCESWPVHHSLLHVLHGGLRVYLR